MDAQERHEKFIYPVVRVAAASKQGQGIGSGVCVYSKDGYTYILTNWHVIQHLINIDEEWDAVAGKPVKRESRVSGQVEFFEYERLSHMTNLRAMKAKLVGWDDRADLAVLELRGKVEYTAPIAEAEPNIFMGDPVVTVGCGMGVQPFPTRGIIAALDCEMDGHDYIMSTAPAIFGNSGGPVLLEATGEVVGLTARIPVIMLGLGGAPITHMSYGISTKTIRDFLHAQKFDFIVDPTKTREECEKERQEIKDEALKAQRNAPEQQEQQSLG